VAQRTGAISFLASTVAAATSARVTLALVAAAFLLAGCGGVSSGEETVGTTGGGSSATADSASGSSSSDKEGTKATAGSKAAAQQGHSASGAGSSGADASAGQGGGAQKHGPRIAQPKGPIEQAPTPKQVAQATVADMSLESPAIIAANGSPGHLAATYTCDGKDSWPALKWGGIPSGTAELILYAMSIQPVEEQLFVDWAVAGLDPGLTGIEAGELPKGAIVGTNGFGKRGYSICPPGAGEIYMFALYALPTPLSPQKGFDARELRHQILDVSANVGLLPAVYARG
jgi:phosphatidylethanolamine-binding protein (PEBP) family uncharacterized protein